MLGVFDSGVGGYSAVYELRARLPRADILYLADRENAPYGTKNRPELIRLVTEDIRRLADRGAEKILIACCTASTVWDSLDGWARDISIPIIRPAAEAAARLARTGIAVIATEATARCCAFKNAISAVSGIAVTELSAQPLVALVEGGARDGHIKKDDMTVISGIAEKIKETGADTLILGCTHFSHLEKTLAALTEMQTVSPARVGAGLLSRECKNTDGRGRIIYL